jgi:hypothetical protein
MVREATKTVANFLLWTDNGFDDDSMIRFDFCTRVWGSMTLPSAAATVSRDMTLSHVPSIVESLLILVVYLQNLIV